MPGRRRRLLLPSLPRDHAWGNSEKVYEFVTKSATLTAQKRRRHLSGRCCSYYSSRKKNATVMTLIANRGRGRVDQCAQPAQHRNVAACIEKACASEGVCELLYSKNGRRGRQRRQCRRRRGIARRIHGRKLGTSRGGGCATGFDRRLCRINEGGATYWARHALCQPCGKAGRVRQVSTRPVADPLVR